MKFSLFLIIALVAGVWHLMGRQRRYALALAPECLLCEGDQITERDDGYHCQTCGFDTDWQHDPAKSETLEVYRALNNARADLQLAIEVLRGEHAQKNDALDLSANYELSAQSYLQHAVRLVPSLLEDHEGQSLQQQYRRVGELQDNVRMLLTS